MPDPTLDDVSRELAAAEEHVVALEQAVIDGDTSVTQQAIEKAKSAVGFLRLQRLGAEKRQAAAEERDREAALAEAYASRKAFYAEGTAAAQAAYAALVDTARTFITEWGKLRTVYSEIGSRAQDMGLELRQDQTWLFDFGPYLDDDGEAFMRAALKEAAGATLHRAHGLHNDKIRAEYTEREDAQRRWEEEREARFAENFTTGPEFAA